MNALVLVNQYNRMKNITY